MRRAIAVILVLIAAVTATVRFLDAMIFGTLARYRAPWPQVRVGLELARSSAAPRVPPASTS